jgi:hypothetical protein
VAKFAGAGRPAANARASQKTPTALANAKVMTGIISLQTPLKILPDAEGTERAGSIVMRSNSLRNRAKIRRAVAVTTQERSARVYPN